MIIINVKELLRIFRCRFVLVYLDLIQILKKCDKFEGFDNKRY